MADKIYPITQASPAASWTTTLSIPLFLALAGLFGYFTFSVKHAKFVLNDVGLHIKNDIYGRIIPKEQLKVSLARIVDLTVDEEYKPKMRTNGLGLPGYQSGWFRLKNGEKALMFLTDRKQAIYIPTINNYSLLISPENPEGFLEDVKRIETVE
jgi:hypothetical protein